MAAAEKALWYIESHYGADIALGDIAGVAGVSPWHLARLFQAQTGWPPVRYLRARRLTEAARRLAAGAPDILEVALASGYGSHEAFTRAFGEHFGLSPDALRARGTVAGLPLVDPLRTVDGPCAPLAEEPRVEHDGARLVAGLGCRYHAATTHGVPAQWQRLALLPRMAGLAGSTAFGVCCNGDDDGNFEYIAGFEVPSFSSLGRPLSTVRLPARRYAVATHRGHISAIRRTWQSLVGHWLPRSGLAAADAPDFERYTPGFDADTGTGDVEIWIPLKD